MSGRQIACERIKYIKQLANDRENKIKAVKRG